MARHPNPNYHKHECERCSGISECVHPSCRGEWYEDMCSECFSKGLNESAAIVARWPEWKRRGVLGPLNTENE